MVKRNTLTIGLPVMNGGDHLRTCLDSLLGQTYTDFQLIISDNASSDATSTICQQYAARDKRIKYVRQQKNIGAVPNFNFVFELSDSDYFKWAAADDYCEPTYLEKTIFILDQNPDVCWCHSLSSHIDDTGRLLQDAHSLNVSYRERSAPTASERFRAVLLGGKGCLDSYGLMRSSFIRRTPLYLPYYGPEKLFIAELSLLGRYAEVPETLFFARVSSSGSGSIQTAADQQAFIDPQRRHPPFLRLRFLTAYLRAIWRSAPGWPEAARCLLAVLQWLMQISKWHKLFLKSLRGHGVGGGNVGRVQRSDTPTTR